MLMRTDPFRELDRLTQQVFGTAARPAAMLMDAYRSGDSFYVHFDLPGIKADSIDLTVEKNVLTVHADRRRSDVEGVELLLGERPHGTFSRQLFLGDALDTDRTSASYVDGVLSSLADFLQMRVLFGFGKPTRPGLSAAANAGIDLDLGTVQYGAVQASYNWNCCGVSVEYRKYELGTSRNDNGYRFNFTLANIGSAGNLRHAEQLF